eukprot:gene203-817_t
MFTRKFFHQMPVVSLRQLRANAYKLARISGCSERFFTSTFSLGSRKDDEMDQHYLIDHPGPDEKKPHKIPTIRGDDIMRNPRLTKSTAFTIEERQILGIHGLLPPAVNNQELQMKRVMEELRRSPSDLQRYIQMAALQARNERLFFRCLMEHTDELMPIVYTPTVGQACQEYGMIFREPRGLFVTVHDLGHVRDIVANWPVENVKAVVMTDGERILGLGDLGCNGLGIPIGKLALYTACAGINPSVCLPIIIDVGTNNEKLLNDPMYIGLRQKRDNSEKYDALIDELISALRNRYGRNTLIQFEDFGNHNAFRFLEKYRSKICTFNDDIQGTAAVCVAGILASLSASNMRLSDHTFMFQGAGEAAIGIAKLLILAMMKEGTSEKDATKKVWMVDSRGLLVKDRAAGGITHEKEPFAHEHDHIKDLEGAVKSVKPTALIGVAAVPGAFTETIVKDMASFNDQPIIFALSNPTSMAECTAEQAYNWTEGKCLFASGSPFDPVTLADGRYFVPGQGNNSYIFPGMALGVISSSSRNITEEMFLTAAQALADQVIDDDLKVGRLYPPLKNIQKVSFNIACKVAKSAYDQKLASNMPEPYDIEIIVRSHVYDPHYQSCIPETFSYPSVGQYMHN